MLNDKELMFQLVRRQRNCEFSLRFILQKEKDLWKNFSTMLKLVKKGTRKEASYDYGEYVVGERLLNIREGLKAISNMHQENGERGKFVIPEYDEFTVRSRSQLQFMPSKARYGVLRGIWPLRFFEFSLEQNRVSQIWHRELLKEGFPYYPNLTEAIIDFFDLSVETFSSHGEVYVVTPDYRARIESLKLSFSRVRLEIYSPEIKYKDLLLKVFAKSGVKRTTLPDIHPESEITEFELGFQPDTLSVVLLSPQENMKIDEKEFTKWSVEEEGVFIERPEEEILSLTKAGESQDLEYKYGIVDKDDKNDFIETVVAFLNTNRGIILVGVDDSGNVVGSEKNAEDLQKMIHDSCVPPPKDVKVEEKEIAGKKIIVVEVPEGDSKPYQSKRDKNWYIRHNANDMRMEWSEMSHILEEIKQAESQGISTY